MATLNDNFKEVIRRVTDGRQFAHHGFDPVYYLVFPPQQMLEVKRQLPAWEAGLKHAGWEVRTFSMAEVLLRIFRDAPIRKFWETADQRDPNNWKKMNQSLADYLLQGALEEQLTHAFEEIKDLPKSILLITDVEALHPYLRIGALEANLQGKVHVPAVILYPGVRTGESRLRFLGFYPEDGNYRSVHVGG